MYITLLAWTVYTVSPTAHTHSSTWVDTVESLTKDFLIAFNPIEMKARWFLCGIPTFWTYTSRMVYTLEKELRRYFFVLLGLERAYDHMTTLHARPCESRSDDFEHLRHPSETFRIADREFDTRLVGIELCRVACLEEMLIEEYRSPIRLDERSVHKELLQPCLAARESESMIKCPTSLTPIRYREESHFGGSEDILREAVREELACPMGVFPLDTRDGMEWETVIILMDAMNIWAIHRG